METDGRFVRIKTEGCGNGGLSLVDYPAVDLEPTQGVQEYFTTSPRKRTPVVVCKIYEANGECIGGLDCKFGHILNKSRRIGVEGEVEEVSTMECSDNVLLVYGVMDTPGEFREKWQHHEGYLSSTVLTSRTGAYGTTYGLVEFESHAAALAALHTISDTELHISFWGAQELFIDAVTQLPQQPIPSSSIALPARPAQLSSPRYSPYPHDSKVTLQKLLNQRR